MDLNLKTTAWILVICALFTGPAPSCSAVDSPRGDTLNNLLQNRQWTGAEAYLLNELLRSRSGRPAVDAAETLARVCVFIHKAPMAMEWLEFALDNPAVTSDKKDRMAQHLAILHRIYFSSETYDPDPGFKTSSIDFESPSDIEITSDQHLVIMDRYRIVNTAESDSGFFSPIQPTSTLPEKAQTLKLVGNEPVIITAYGYWKNHRMYEYSGRGELNRIIDAVFTVDGTWLVLDRRHSDMLQFDSEGAFIRPMAISPLNGDEKLVTHIFGGCWMIDPAGRQITSVGSGVVTRIPFKGPGYELDDPLDMATDWFGHLYVLCEDSTVTIFSPSGVRLRRIDLERDGNELRDPRAISVDAAGRLYVADRKKHAIFRFH